MNTTKLRVLIIAILVTGTVALSALALSTNASAASIAGTWVSRESGKGYTQSYLGPYGDMVTEYFDIELVLSGSGSTFSGTLTSTGYGYTQSYPVEGTFDGTTFLMTAYYGWDGVNYVTPEYTLTVSGSEMYGSASYLNVGVTIYGTFDLRKEGLFGINGIAPIASGATIAISIIAIVVAASPPRPSVPKGFRPEMKKVVSPSSRYEPSNQWTTEVPSGPVSGDGTVPAGGIGLTWGVAIRPMSEAERTVVRAIPKSQRNNAIGMAVVAMVMAVMVLFIEEEIAAIMPIFFGFIGLATALGARKSAGLAGKALGTGTVTDVAVSPRWPRTGNCDLGGFSVSRSGQMKKMLVEGVPATVSVLPEAKRMISVNGVPLKAPVTIIAPAEFEVSLAAKAAAQSRKEAKATEDEMLPPPPDDWQPGRCPNCGKDMDKQTRFCQNCGYEIGTRQ